MDVTVSKSARFSIVNPTYRALRHAIILVVVYIVLLFILPISKDTMHTYNLTTFEFRVINFAVALPTLLVWLAAFMAYATLRQYAHSLKATAEAEHFDKLATGCAWLAWSLPVTGLFSLILSSLDSPWPGFHNASIILINYLDLLMPLIAFSVIGIASRGLVSQANVKLSLASARIIILLFLTAGVLYCYLTFRHFNLNNLGSNDNPYYLPVWLMVLSVMIPYLYAWFVGLLATYEITLLSKQVQGLLYRRALQLLVGGLVIIIISSIAMQYLNGVAPRVGHLELDYKLVATVVFRIIGGAGFLVLTVGALKLKKIEEV